MDQLLGHNTFFLHSLCSNYHSCSATSVLSLGGVVGGTVIKAGLPRTVVSSRWRAIICELYTPGFTLLLGLNMKAGHDSRAHVSVRISTLNVSSMQPIMGTVRGKRNARDACLCICMTLYRFKSHSSLMMQTIAIYYRYITPQYAYLRVLFVSPG